MKKALLFFAGVLLVTSNIFGQAITLNLASYTSSPIGTDSLKVTTAASIFPSFAPATNHTWDLSTVTDSAANLFAYRVAAAPATFADSNYYTLGTNTYQGNVQSIIAAAGYAQSAIKIQNATYPIGTTAGDTIYILAQQDTFFTSSYSHVSSPRTVIKFPATMSTSWASTYESSFNYQVSYVPGYNHAPGIVKSYYTETDTVIGWGTMRIKTLAGIPSGYSAVLQVRTQIKRTDSFYLNGTTTDPLINPLLTVIGDTQGQVTRTYEQNFYRVNEVTPLAYIQFSDSANTTPTKATTHVQRLPPNGVANVFNDANVKIYPNPVSGRNINIDVPVTAGEWKYELVNISGQTVAADMLQLSNNQTHTQIRLSPTLTPGIYYIRLINDGKQVTVKPLEIK